MSTTPPCPHYKPLAFSLAFQLACSLRRRARRPSAVVHVPADVDAREVVLNSPRMTRTGNAPFDAYLRDPEPGPPPPLLSDRLFDIDNGVPSSSSMAHPFYNSGVKHVEASSFNYPYQHPYAQHPHHNGDDDIRSRNSSGSSSGRSAISPQVDLPQLTLSPNIFGSGNGNTRNAGGSTHTGLQFQMPSFLGGISAVAPGGGGEVINPTGLPLFPSFSVSGNGMSTMAPPMTQYAGWASNGAQMVDPLEKTWLNKQTYVSLLLAS